MILLDGQTLAQKIVLSLKSQIKSTNLHLQLATILVGNNPSSLKYIDLKRKKSLEVGIDFQLHHLPQSTSQKEIATFVNKLNLDPAVSGFFIQLPLPPQLNQSALLSSIDPKKDVDGLNPASRVIPAVDRGIIRLLDEYKIDLKNKNVVIVNDSSLIGLPLKSIFLSRHSHVNTCNKYTKDLKSATRTADILISATGVKNLITADFIKPKAVVVDVAGGDVDFQHVSPKAGYITPTFGGIGPMTIASLLETLVALSSTSLPPGIKYQ